MQRGIVGTPGRDAVFKICDTVTSQDQPSPLLTCDFEACANSGGKAPADVAEFLPWNFLTDRLSELLILTAGNSNPNTS